jgi:UDP-N-acetylmuramate dehydrogenase
VSAVLSDLPDPIHGPGFDLLNRLPAVRGRLTPNAPLGMQSWFRVGGAADILFRPADVDDLCGFLSGCPDDVPVMVIGVGSNILIRDGGVEGVVIRLGKEFAQITQEGTNLYAGAGVIDLTLALTARDAGLGGLEFLSGIPGTIGGAVRMNAGAYNSETKDWLLYADIVTRNGQKQRLNAEQLGLSYRHSDLPTDAIVVGAAFRSVPDNKNHIAARIEKIQQAREDTQPIRARTGGSTFANPPGDQKAWQLIDAAGCRGLTVGGAQVSEKHCNFLINQGNASAEDLENLGETVRMRVEQTSGINLRWEIKRIGRKGPA